MSDELVRTQEALQQLHKSLAKQTLADLVKARTSRPLLLVDCSGSMSERIATGQQKIEALRQVVKTLRETHPVAVAAFGLGGSSTYEHVALVDTIPEPSGGTPMHAAIDFAKGHGATHIVLVTDGLPDSQTQTFEAARQFGGRIDVFYVGDGQDEGAGFCKALAQMTGGASDVTDLGEQKKLATKIAGCLPEGRA